MTAYDHIVVGAGTAGCVLAARLSEDDRTRVLLLEAGGREPLPATSVPSEWPTLQGTRADWGDMTVTQEATGYSVPWPRGRGLGGSSAINAMIFVRGHRSTYDAWAEAGAKGWGFDDLLPYFKRSENLTGVPDRDPAERGMAGPLRPAPAASRHPLSEDFLAGASDAGHRAARDITSGLEEGFGWCDLNIAGGRRQDASDAYLRPALDRPNLTVVTDALVHRLTLAGGRCTGVTYSADDEVRTADAAEVVLSAGTVGTPQVLMLSGIGPQPELRRLGIATVMHLPGVGANLQDHPMSGIVYRSMRTVPVGRNNHGEALGLIRTSPESPGPDIQLLMAGGPQRRRGLPGPGLGEGYSILVSLMRPRSRGTIRLADATPGSPPLIDPRYYTDAHDLKVMTAGLRAGREIGDSMALWGWQAEEALPGAAVEDEERLRSYLRSNLRSYDHFAGTCRIGTDEDAVVDEDLRVHGVDGLRIADASVMPTIISGNTNATVYAIAERAADLIRGAS